VRKENNMGDCLKMSESKVGASRSELKVSVSSIQILTGLVASYRQAAT